MHCLLAQLGPPEVLGAGEVVLEEAAVVVGLVGRAEEEVQEVVVVCGEHLMSVLGRDVGVVAAKPRAEGGMIFLSFFVFSLFLM